MVERQFGVSFVWRALQLAPNELAVSFDFKVRRLGPILKRGALNPAAG